jgi:ribosomal protein L9
MKKHISELTPKEIEEFNQSIASASAQYDVEQAFAEAIKRTIDNVYAVDISEKTARSMAALSASATPSGITKFSSKMKQLQEEANREAIRKRKVDNALVRLAKRHAAELTTVAQRNRFIRTRRVTQGSKPSGIG